MLNVADIDPKTLRQGRATDRLIAELVYRQRVETDADGELRVAGECGHDPTPGEQDVRELAIVPQYSRDALLAEQAFVVATGRCGECDDDYTAWEPGGIYGDSAWTLRDNATRHKLASAPSKALLYCQAAIIMLQRAADSEPAST